MDSILLLCEYPTLNGGERSFLSVLDGVRQAGFEITVACPPAGELADTLRSRRVAVLPFHFSNGNGVRFSQDELRQRLTALIQGGDFDLLHANSLSMARLAGPTARQLGIPSIGHLRDILALSRQAIDDINQHTRLLAVSNATRNWHVGHGIREEITHVLYNGVDVNRFRPRPAKGFLHAEFRLPRQTPLVATIGQLVLRKGTDLFVEAARRVADENPDAHFLCIGERYSEKDEAVELEERLIHWAQQPPLAGRFRFLGLRDDVHAILNEITVLSHCARQEPLGRVLLEAAASGVPVAATRVGGTPEIFPPGSEAAMLVTPDDADEMAEAILQLLNTPHQRHRMSACARGIAQQHFDARRAAISLAEHYRELTKRT